MTIGSVSAEQQHGAPFTLVLEMVIHPGMLEEFLTAIAAGLPDSLASDGCLGMRVLQVEDAPSRVVMIEEWRDPASFDAYAAWRQSVDGDLWSRYYDPDQVREYRLLRAPGF